MTRENTWLNNDGLEVPFGTSNGIQADGATIHTKGMTKELRLDLDHSDLPRSGTAVQGNNVGIPSGASILSARLHTSEVFSGAITVGLMGADGVTEDADGLIASTTPAANSVTVGSGALINTVAGEDLYVHVVGAVTTGAGQLVIEYTI